MKPKDYIPKTKSFFYAFLCYLLFLGLQEHIQMVINKCLLPLFKIKACTPLDVFFCFIAFLFIGYVIVGIRKNKIQNVSELAFPLFLLAVYLYYRIDENTYSFVRFNWRLLNGIAYVDILVGGFVLDVIGLKIGEGIRYVKDRCPKQVKTETIFLALEPDETLKDITKDKFGMGEYVKSVVSYLEKVDISQKAFSLGIVGRWGYGKSSFFHFIKNEIQNNEKFVIMDFNPRSSKNINYIQEDFLNGLRDAIQPYYSNLTWRFEEYARSLNISTDVSSILSFIFRLLKIHVKSSEENYEIINTIMGAINRRIVVFVDDMDRLTAKELLEVMKVIDKNGAFKNVIFVSAYDKEYVNGALKSYLNHSVACPYTDKYFDLEIRLPKHSFHLLKSYLQELLEKVSDSKNIEISKEELAKQIQKASPYLEKRLKTIRDVKRFFNMFLFDYPSVQKNVYFHDYLLLELMKFSHKDEYDKLREFEYINRPSKDDSNNEILCSPFTFESLPESLDIIRELFPEQVTVKLENERENQRIFFTTHFDIYFYNKEYDFFLYKTLNSLFTFPLKVMCEKINSSFELLNNSCLKITDILNTVKGFSSKHFRQKSYLQFYAYLYYKYQTEECLEALSDFLLKENESNKVLQGETNKEQDYLSWIIESMKEFYEVYPKTVSCFFSLFTESSINKNLTNLFSKDELQHASKRLLEMYIENISTNPNFSASVCYALANICDDDKSYNKAAMMTLKNVMIKFPEKFLKSLDPVCYPSNNGYLICFRNDFAYRNVFPKSSEFELILSKGMAGGYENIDTIDNFYELYRKNAFAPIFVEKIETQVHDKIEELMKVVREFDKINSLVKAIKSVLNDKDLKGLDHAELKLKVFIEKLNGLNLEIHYKRNLRKKINVCLDKINIYRKKLKEFPENVCVGDFIKIHDDHVKQYNDKYGFNSPCNIYEIEKITEYEVKFKNYNHFISKTDLSAVPIDGKADRRIYYEPTITTVGSRRRKRLPRSNKNLYYMEKFKTLTYAGYTYWDIVKEYNFMYVHEVQHWLRETFKQDLKINTLYTVTV